MDCDPPGRNAAAQIANDLAGVAASVTVADLDPKRQDGYDLSDHIRDRRRAARHRAGPRPVAWPIASLLEHLTVVPTPPPTRNPTSGRHR